ncbi:MAG: TIGR01777 family oxidoreductase [Nocardioidaceae bacterium]
MRYVIAGSSGFLGTALRDRLARAGHQVVRLMRSDSPSPYASGWNPYAGQVDLDVIDSADVVVNLAGAPIIRLWTPTRRRAILDSRVATTATLARAIATVDASPVLLAQSGVHAYGADRGDTVLTEDTVPSGGQFMYQVVREWERATEPAAEAGSRVCNLRTGAPLGRRGGALQVMLPAFQLGLAGPVGGGAQYFPAISLEDWLSAVLFLGEDPDANGPFNLAGPEPATNAEFTTALGKALHRPTAVRVPAFAVRVAGELSDQLLGSLRVVPQALRRRGYEFRHRTINEIVAAALA